MQLSDAATSADHENPGCPDCGDSLMPGYILLMNAGAGAVQPDEWMPCNLCRRAERGVWELRRHLFPSTRTRASGNLHGGSVSSGTVIDIDGGRSVDRILADALRVLATRPTEGRLSGSEALFAFMGWITTRREAVTFSATHDAAPAASLVKEFLTVQGLPEPADGWDKKVVPMPGPGRIDPPNLPGMTPPAVTPADYARGVPVPDAKLAFDDRDEPAALRMLRPYYRGPGGTFQMPGEPAVAAESPEAFLYRMHHVDGLIVSPEMISAVEQENARERGRLYVDSNGRGYAIVPRDTFIHRDLVVRPPRPRSTEERDHTLRSFGNLGVTVSELAGMCGAYGVLIGARERRICMTHGAVEHVSCAIVGTDAPAVWICLQCTFDKRRRCDCPEVG